MLEIHCYMSPNLFNETRKNLISKGKLLKNSIFQANLIFVAMFGVITVAFGIESFTARQNFVISFEYFFSLDNFCRRESRVDSKALEARTSILIDLGIALKLRSFQEKLIFTKLQNNSHVSKNLNQNMSMKTW